MNISNNISALQSQQQLLNTSANNIANVNTNGFKPVDTIISNSAGSPTPHSRLADDNGSKRSQTDLSKEITTQIVAQDASALNVEAIKAQDELLGTLLDIKA